MSEARAIERRLGFSFAIIRASLSSSTLTLALGCSEGSGLDEDAARAELARVHCAATCDVACAAGGVSGAECETKLELALGPALSRAKMLGAMEQLTCLDLAAEVRALAACRSATEVVADAGLAEHAYAASRCKFLVGESAIGEACTSFGDGVLPVGDTCKPSLACREGVCVALAVDLEEVCMPLGIPPLDDPASMSSGIAIDPQWFACPPEYQCLDPDRDAVYRCHRRGELGAACSVRDGTLGCMEGCVCDPASSACVTAPSVGSPCVSGQCGAGGTCMAERCEPRGDVGDTCVTGSCVPGLMCGPEAGGAAVCIDPGPWQCDVESAVAQVCPFVGDGICDDSSGTGVCEAGTDSEDCAT